MKRSRSSYCAIAGTRLARIALLDHHAVHRAAAEGLRVVHLLRFRRRNDELAGSGCARDVAVLVHAFPQQAREGFRSFVAQALVLVPRAPPPPERAALLRFL